MSDGDKKRSHKDLFRTGYTPQVKELNDQFVLHEYMEWSVSFLE
jgi:hypothetical protein